MSVRSNIPMTRDEEGNSTLIPESRQSNYEGMSLPTLSTVLMNKINPRTTQAAKKLNSECDGKGFAPAATSTPTPEKTTWPKGADTTDNEDGWSDYDYEPLQILPVPQEAARQGLNPLAEEWKPSKRQTDISASPPSIDGLTTDESESSWESYFASVAIDSADSKIVNARPEAAVQPREEEPRAEDAKANEEVVKLPALEETEAPQDETPIQPRFSLENKMQEFIACVQTGLMSESDKIAKWNSLATEHLLWRRHCEENVPRPRQ